MMHQNPHTSLWSVGMVFVVSFTQCKPIRNQWKGLEYKVMRIIQ